MLYFQKVTLGKYNVNIAFQIVWSLWEYLSNNRQTEDMSMTLASTQSDESDAIPVQSKTIVRQSDARRWVTEWSLYLKVT